MKKYNVGILAHVDAGKTTITEQMLLLSGAIRKGGSVDEGTTTSDYLEIERRRGISVLNSCVTFRFEDAEIHLIDTPGHLDFSGEVSRSYAALDGVILVLSGGEEIRGRTKTILETLRRLRLPAVIAINKTDLPGFDRERFLGALRKDLTESFFLPEELPTYLPALAELDEEMEELFLLDGTAEAETLRSRANRYVKEGLLYPVTFLSAKNGSGVQELLRAVTTWLPDASLSETKELSGVVFQLRHNEQMGKEAYVRLFGGTLSARDAVRLSDAPEKEANRISQIRAVQGSRAADVGTMRAGDIAAVYGLSDARIGSVIGSDPTGRILERSRGEDAQPLLYAEVRSETPQEELALARALTILSEEDPLLRYERNPMTHQSFLHVMGEIQIEILRELIRQRFGLTVSFSEPRIIYRETPGSAAEGLEVYTMPKPCWAIVRLRVEPLPAGSGLEFRSAVKENVLAVRYQNHVHDSVFDTARQGLFGWELTDCRITLTDGNSHQWHTHPLDFFTATPVALLRALQNSGEVLLEPYMKLRLTAENGLLGKITGQILQMRGAFDTPEMGEERFSLTATAPLKDCMNYAAVFRSLTGGKGQIDMKLDSYRPAAEDDHTCLPRRGVDPLDHAKWILSRRGGITEGG